MQTGLAALPADGGKLAARARLRLLNWRVEAGQGDTAALKTGFRGVVEERPPDDKAHMQFALFLCRAYDDLRTRCALACLFLR